MSRLVGWFTNLYPVWIIGSSVLALMEPRALAWFSGGWVVLALTLVMLSMGLTLTVDDFRRLIRMPGAVVLGFSLQYLMMPLIGWMAAAICGLNAGLTLGLVLVASCPGGTASNLITFLARGNLALSVVMTMVSTLLAFIMTPFWCKVLAGELVAVDPVALSLSTLQVVVLPVLIGVCCNWCMPRQVAKVLPLAPPISVLAIIFIAGGIVAQSADSVVAHAGPIAVAVLILHALGFGISYMLGRLLGFQVNCARTISIEVGMQNGGMAAMLAQKNFSALLLAGVPAVFSSVIQTVLGSLLAAYWRARPFVERSVAFGDSLSTRNIKSQA